jgi:hypothetical protein
MRTIGSTRADWGTRKEKWTPYQVSKTMWNNTTPGPTMWNPYPMNLQTGMKTPPWRQAHNWEQKNWENPTHHHLIHQRQNLWKGKEPMREPLHTLEDPFGPMQQMNQEPIHWSSSSQSPPLQPILIQRKEIYKKESSPTSSPLTGQVKLSTTSSSEPFKKKKRDRQGKEAKARRAQRMEEAVTSSR